MDTQQRRLFGTAGVGIHGLDFTRGQIPRDGGGREFLFCETCLVRGVGENGGGIRRTEGWTLELRMNRTRAGHSKVTDGVPAVLSVAETRGRLAPVFCV